ncbi:hypothetical protein FRC02_001827 [Tulasnella sp. 418]|nr:hypothetical protein FRC02_001827 [Tulasnella sp. 418]
MDNSSVIIAPPPILEIEDTVYGSNTMHTSSTILARYEAAHEIYDMGEPVTSYDGNRGDSKGIENDGVKGAPTLGPERPLPGINDHLQFWTTFDRVAGAYDRELLDAWNKSLDVLLIFPLS